MPPPSVPQPLPGVERILAVASGKGGVGKSTIAYALARGFSQKGLRVGLLDADIHGPSLPSLLDIHEKPTSLDGKNLEPLAKDGLLVMSMGFLIPEDQAAIWRGPMMHHALHQIIFNVNWGQLDILVIDLPPGTGDVPLSLAQKLLMEAVVVSTPQELALLDVRRALQMFKKVGVPVLGLIENMGTFHCDHCHTEAHLWGEDGVLLEAQRQNLPLLGRIPLNPRYQKPLTKENPLPEEALRLGEAVLQAMRVKPDIN